MSCLMRNFYNHLGMKYGNKNKIYTASLVTIWCFSDKVHVCFCECLIIIYLTQNRHNQNQWE